MATLATLETSVDLLSTASTDLLAVCTTIKADVATDIATAVSTSINTTQIPLTDIATNLITTQALIIGL
jgi:hypothetical protein